MKNKRQIAVCSVLILCASVSLNIHAQKLVPASRAEQQEMREKIGTASQKMTNLICNFEQVKELSILNDKMISKGKMYYRNDNCLRWEYLSPYSYTFVLNDKKILMQTGDSRNVIDLKSSKFFQEIVKIMMNGINGSGLTDLKSFEASYYKKETEWEIHLLPLQKDMKQMFSAIKLTFNTKNYTVDQVEMNERNGDATLIRLFDKQFNNKIEDDTFHID
ncbi:MAG: outer membrane lipoprotein carrier protein LolA [Tannerellaceae bacterium]|jgi:outer membrane lipoprotein carrier protein|nr:outer membrane lipoprotein carrier protein LolA [Tannerellaceae bacterium]